MKFFVRLAVIFQLGLFLSACAPNEEKKDVGDLVMKQYTQEQVKKLAPTDLHKAILLKNFDLVEKLMRDSANVNQVNKEHGDTPLHLALKMKLLKIAEYMVESPSLDIYKTNKAKESYLFLASQAGSYRTIIELVRRHKSLDNWLADEELEDLDIPNKKGQRALHVAATADVAEVLRKAWGWNNLDVLYKDAEGTTAMHQAAKDQRVSFLEWANLKFCSDYHSFIHDSVLPDSVNDFLVTHLKGAVEWFRWLSPDFQWEWYSVIAANPFNYPDHLGRSTIHHAVLSNSNSIVATSLSCQFSDITLADQNGQTPLHLSATLTERSILKLILKANIEFSWWIERADLINGKDHKGNTPLHLAAINKDPYFYQELLREGGNPKIVNSEGFSAEQLFNENQKAKHLRQKNYYN